MDVWDLDVRNMEMSEIWTDASLDFRHFKVSEIRILKKTEDSLNGLYHNQLFCMLYNGLGKC